MKIKFSKVFALISLLPISFSVSAVEKGQDEGIIAKVIQPLMKKHGIPGMAVGVIHNGKTAIYNFGIMSKETSQAVSEETIFEVGSISKTMTATLASYAQVKGRLSLEDRMTKLIPDLKKSDFDQVTLLNLGTHTAGGLPLQVPESIKDVESLIQYYQSWKSSHPVGTLRAYSNISIGLLGWITAKSFQKEYETLMKEQVFPKLGLQNTYLSVPESQMKNYAQGYSEDNLPKRLRPGVFYKEAYGVRTTAKDLLQFLKANMQLMKVDADLSKALLETHRSYFQVKQMTQDLIWEQYPYPVTLNDLLEGNSKNANLSPAVKIVPSKEPQTNVWINKTGSTSGFAAYVAFIPSQKSGIILLGNKNYPIAARVTAAYEILNQLK